MRQIDENIQKVLNSNLTYLVLCCKIMRSDGVELCFTETDKSVIVDNQVYSTCASLSAIRESCDLTTSDFKFETILNSELIKTEDISRGLFDEASVEIFMIDLSVVDEDGRYTRIVCLKRGRIGEIRISGNNKFAAQIHDITFDLNRNITNRYSLTCRAIFGDKKCGMNVDNFTYEGSITKIIDKKSFMDVQNFQESGYFDNGFIIFWNEDRTKIIEKTNVKFFINKTFELCKPTNINLIEGILYTANVGCDKTSKQCSQKFKNIANFRGEPHIPGIEKMYRKG